MRDHLVLWVNGRRWRIAGAKAFQPLSRFLREELRQTGTKIVCEEGDCGACTVLLGRPEEARFLYRPVNSCIQFLFQLDGAHIITVEGLRRDRALAPVQEAMVRCHGAQCGYCTPGFVVALSGLLEEKTSITEQDARDAVTGNLCRCTGYEPILRAALETDCASHVRANELYPPGAMLRDLSGTGRDTIRIETPERTFFRPTDLRDAVRFRADHPGAAIIQGATDAGVVWNKKGLAPTAILSLSGIEGLDDLRVDDGRLLVGARVTLSEFESSVRELVPEMYSIMQWFGSPQIRNTATLAGNIANASPIADTLPFLFVMDATLELTGSGGERSIPIRSFYLGYKKLDLKPDEIIRRIVIPLPESAETLRLYKISKRSHLDIASFTAAFRMRRTNGTIDSLRIAYGGVAPTVVRLARTEAFLRGRSFELASFEAAGPIAREEIAPISDVRGSREFRLQLAENILKKFYYEASEAGA